MDRARRSNGAWEIDLFRPGPSTARSDRCAKLLLLWSAAVAVPVLVFVLAGYVWGSVATAVVVVALIWFTCCYYRAAPPEPPLLPEHLGALRVDVPVGQPRPGQVNGVGGLSQEDVEAIPAFEYQRKKGVPAEQCAVCINVVRDGETVRRLPACGHAFHAPCVDGWLRAHATCPMCRADVKVAASEPPTWGSDL
ncbi:hypothetical protein SEVIR_3G321200v4 [Setaria viridis]|uniref:RING-type domain-containing protein n=3 Tax=Setaria TaxID=4554 RepID=A0A368QKW4_SETIT|nr:E3 ubiquitin-protein ligase ATL6 [Setaria italica]XP_034587917.1 E3 ubiquitin-protein ligase ATL6-like [Setaria viridis]RCV18454.1 hypothetical protein SETIT_3G302000v2 [Setaria italica]TKW28245.1 hypothetical protein SEVIR_3G321200v2 [Setaria viridis]